jgi:hypothetical protein
MPVFREGGFAMQSMIASREVHTDPMKQLGINHCLGSMDTRVHEWMITQGLFREVMKGAEFREPTIAIASAN